MSHGFLSISFPAENASLTDKIPFKTLRASESSIPINKISLERESKTSDSSVSTNLSPSALNNVTIKTEKENVYPVDDSTKISLLTLNDTIETVKENCESSDFPSNACALTIENGIIEMEREIFETDNLSMNASPLTSTNVFHSSCSTKLELQEDLKRNAKISKKCSADKNVDDYISPII